MTPVRLTPQAPSRLADFTVEGPRLINAMALAAEAARLVELHSIDPDDCPLHRLFVHDGEPTRGSWHTIRCELFAPTAGDHL